MNKLKIGSIKTSCVPVLVLMLACAGAAHGTPTQEDIVKSFNENMSQPPDYGKLLPWFFAFCGAVAVIVYFNQRQKRQAIPMALNHPKKLIKEMVKGADIDPAEMKKMTQLARELDCESPLTLMLCPSLMNKDGKDQATE
jgi:hypothetical protein